MPPTSHSVSKIHSEPHVAPFAASAGGILSPELQEILFDAAKRRAFLDEFRGRVPPRLYQMVENRITTLQRLCERLLEADATMDAEISGL